MSMSKKQYVEVAKAIKAERSVMFGISTVAGRNAVDASTRRLAEAFADVFAKDNPNFIRATFMAACDVT